MVDFLKFDGSRSVANNQDKMSPPLRTSKSRIIFGSCNSQLHKEQPLWPVIESRNATAFIWGGDAVYADDRRRSSTSDDASANNDDDNADAEQKRKDSDEAFVD